MEKRTFTRTELYDLVWSKPMKRISQEYRISYYKLRNTCEKMQIPIPDYGHWMRIKYNNQVEVKELSNDYKGDANATFEMIDFVNHDKGVVQSEKERIIKKVLLDHNELTKVSSKLRNPDKLIIAAKIDLETNKNHSIYDPLIKTSRGVIDMTVSPRNVPRALRFMDSMVKLIKERGHDIQISGHETFAIIYGADINICLQEKLRIEETPNNYGWNSRKYFASDILTFRIWKDYRFQQKVWGDNKHNIEDLLPKILASLELLAKKEIEKRRIRDEEHKIWLEKQRMEEERKKVIENEFEHVKELFTQATLVHKANVLKGYVKAIEENAIQNRHLSKELAKWIDWARNKIDWFDPLTLKEDPVLNDEFRKTIYREIIEGRI